MTTRQEAVQDITHSLEVIERKFKNDVESLRNLIDQIQQWGSADQDSKYNGELKYRVSDMLLSLTNNSNWISYVGSAIRDSSEMSE
jgi:hypothetical protein